MQYFCSQFGTPSMTGTNKLALLIETDKSAVDGQAHQLKSNPFKVQLN